MSISRKLFDLEIAIRSVLSRYRNGFDRLSQDLPINIYLCVVDHYEPSVGKASREIARKRHEEWLRAYPSIASRYRDCQGAKAVHTFFYPWDEYDEWELETLVDICRDGCGEIELHLHHSNDNDQSLRIKLSEAIQTYYKKGALSQWKNGSIAFGFIHGNWALDNSRIENGINYCGVNNEISILRELGCYADFTFPSWRHISQPKIVNAIYYATDNPAKPKSYNNGLLSRNGCDPSKTDLLMVQGPLYTHTTKNGRIAMDDANLAASNRYDAARFNHWINSRIHVFGNPNDIFIKLHCHGAADKDREKLLYHDLPALYNDAIKYYNDGKYYRIHFITARQLFNVIKYNEKEVEFPHSSNKRDWFISSRFKTVNV